MIFSAPFHDQSSDDYLFMTKRFVPTYQNNKVRLRLLEAADLPLTLSWRNQDNIRRWFFSSDVITLEGHKQWFQKYAERDDDFIFIFEEIDRNYDPVGQLSLYHIDWDQCSAEFGRLMIGKKEAAGKGLAVSATSLVLDIARREFGLREIYLEVFADNAAAVAVYKHCGFEIVSDENNVLKMCVRI